MSIIDHARVVFLGCLLSAWLGAIGAVPDPAGPLRGPQPGGQQPERQQPEAQQPMPKQPAEHPGGQEALRAQHELLKQKRADLQELRRELAEATDPDRQKALAEQITKAGSEIDQLQRQLEAIATGVDRRQFEGTEEAPFDLAHEVQDLLEPLIQQLKEVTKTPRQIQQMERQIEDAEQRKTAAREAVRNLERRVLAAEGELGEELVRLLEVWRGRQRDAERERRTAELALSAKLASQKSFLESAGELADSFFRERWLNLLLAGVAFLGVFLALRLLPRGLRRLNPRRHGRERPFYARLLDVLYSFFSVVAAFGVMMLVLYVANDWIVLVLVLVFLVGVGWASIRLMPSLFEQIRLILNLGSVRENERIVWEGIPWQVSHLGIYTSLVNHALSGGRLRIPVRDLIGKHSRPMGADEDWFPCREGDWVLLSDDTRGRVVSQTPEFVRLELLGGCPVSYPTTGFLGLAPRNLSRDFRIRVTFGVDYQHQAICTTEIPTKMQEKLERELSALLAEDELRKLSVEFKEAGPSSLDYEVLADLAGSAARRYDVLKRAIGRILVDACNENGWVIPFTQVTIHNAAS